jgi:hypothetical protein
MDDANEGSIPMQEREVARTARAAASLPNCANGGLGPAAVVRRLLDLRQRAGPAARRRDCTQAASPGY